MLAMSNWGQRRWTSLIVHVVFAAIPFMASTAAAFNLWAALFGAGNWGYAALAVGTMEILALSSLILHIAHIEWPLSWLRHTLPFISILPLGWGLYELLAPNAGPWAVAIAVPATIWLVFLSFQLFTSMERLFIDPIEAMRERTTNDMKVLATTLTSYQVATRSMHDFALGVLDPGSVNQLQDVSPIHPALTADQPTVPLLQASEDAHPRMLEIAMLAGKRTSDGAWLYSSEEIRAHVPVAMPVIDVIVRLVRGGHMAVATEEPSHDTR